MGFYETGKTDSKTLFEIVKDVLIRFNLKMSNLRGQCYDGASNVSGRIYRLVGTHKRHRTTSSICAL